MLDPRTGEPFLLTTSGDSVKLYGLGKNGKDDGGHIDDDDVVWP